MINKFKKVLELYDFYLITTKHPKICKNLFVLNQQQPGDADYLYTPLKPEYSDAGTGGLTSAYREALAWKDCHAIDDLDEVNSDGEKFTEANLGPAAVVGWLTGQRHRDIAHKIPIYVKFDHECKKRNPRQSVCFQIIRACSREVTFPVEHMATLDEFKKKLFKRFQ